MAVLEVISVSKKRRSIMVVVKKEGKSRTFHLHCKDSRNCFYWIDPNSQYYCSRWGYKTDSGDIREIELPIYDPIFR